jgi:thiosulfate/3-mercaptopyruvate sulfurtransferase
MSDITASETAAPLVAPEWLAERLADRNLLIIDIRSVVDGGARAAYEAAHIPGAIHTDYAKDGWRAVKGMAAGLLPDPDALARLLGGLGLAPHHHAVIVSAGTTVGDFSAAARVYWTLKIAGHANISILAGGMTGWRRNPERPIETGTGPAPAALASEASGQRGSYSVRAPGTRPEPGSSARASASTYPVKLVGALRAELDAVKAAVADKSSVLLDSRAANYFAGAAKSPQVARPGRLPGATLLDHAAAFGTSAMALKPKAALEKLFADVPAKPVINYCNTGHQAATNWFVLSEVLRRPDVSLYDGSLSQWAEDDSHAVETGEAASSSK